MKLEPPFRNDSNQRYSKQLFYEQWTQLPIEMRAIEPAFSLHIKRDGLICFREEYVNDGDMSGYTTSVRLLGDYGYWKHLMKAGWFRDAVAEWNEELEAKLYAEGMAKIRTLASSDDKGALTAAKYLADKQFKEDKGKVVRGRPSKEEVEGNLKAMSRDMSDTAKDAERIGLLKVVTNG